MVTFPLKAEMPPRKDKPGSFFTQRVDDVPDAPPGNREAPTLRPSIKRNTPCRWHGHLVEGYWTHNGDAPTR